AAHERLFQFFEADAETLGGIEAGLLFERLQPVALRARLQGFAIEIGRHPDEARARHRGAVGGGRAEAGAEAGARGRARAAWLAAVAGSGREVVLEARHRW